MAFTTIPSGSIDVGDAIRRELFVTIKDSLDDHEARILATEGVASRIIAFDSLILLGSSAPSVTGLMYFRATQPFTLTGMALKIFEIGTLSGTLEVDIKKNTSFDNAGMVSVFTTKPSVNFASDYQESSNQVFDNAEIDLVVGDILRLDITSLPTGGQLGKFYFTIYGEV
jgi:hypothetical protein